MKHRRLEMIANTEDERGMGRREAFGVLLGGAVVTYTACSSTTVEPPASSSDTDAGTTDDSGTTAPCDNPPAGVDVGDVSGFPSGSWSAAGTRNDPYIVAQDANGYFAFSAICTHQGCQVDAPNASSGKTSCPCHGAQFDGNGAVLRGPARSPLPHYAVALCGTHLYVDSSTTVDASARTAATP
jgi:thiosulfate dehydrogenase (quinone) large subunit